MTTKNNEPAPAQDTASVLLGMEGVTVTGAEEAAGGRLAVWARVSRPAACPGCGTVSERVHEYVTTRPRDVRHGSREVDLFLEKRRLARLNGDCPRGTFTEWAPQVPPRCRITRRLLEHCGEEVAGQGLRYPRVYAGTLRRAWSGTRHSLSEIWGLPLSAVMQR